MGSSERSQASAGPQSRGPHDAYGPVSRRARDARPDPFLDEGPFPALTDKDHRNPFAADDARGAEPIVPFGEGGPGLPGPAVHTDSADDSPGALTDLPRGGTGRRARTFSLPPLPLPDPPPGAAEPPPFRSPPTGRTARERPAPGHEAPVAQVTRPERRSAPVPPLPVHPRWAAAQANPALTWPSREVSAGAGPAPRRAAAPPAALPAAPVSPTSPAGPVSPTSPAADRATPSTPAAPELAGPSPAATARTDPLTDPDYRRADRERALALAERRFAVTVENSPSGFAVLTAAGEIRQVNRALTRMLARPAGDLLGRRITDFCHPGDPDADAELMTGLIDGRRDSYTLERRYLRPRGETIWARTTVTAVRDPDGLLDHLVCQFHDVTEMRLAEEALTHQALHDPLTGLPNRILTLDRIQQAIDRTRRTRRRVAVLCCSLDRFNVVNDGGGHDHGDAVLVEVARRLERILRTTDTAARLNGDEFAVVCEDVADEREAVLVADRIRGAVRDPIEVGGLQIVQTVSIGIAVSSARAADAVSLLRDAGTALHRAKENGQDNWDVVDDELRHRAVERLDIEHALRAAIGQHDLRVFFQPIVDLSTRRPVGHEALVRWQHPTRGLLAPAWFLPVAEETGLIEDIGRWVLLEAARSAAERPGSGYVAVNVSASQVMRAGLVADVETVLEETGLPPSRLVVELTESVMLGAAPAGRKELHKLDDLGVRVVVDDFGTGFSPLSYLRDLPISGIKVDRSFTAGLGQDSQCERIVEALTGLAGGLGVDLVAEGVETERQLTLLTQLGCVHAQGYLFGRPAPHDPVLVG
jgi:diguanylate cyclase (GGDEF)-like protein/PAS domain S-box-containing protein